MLNVSNLKIQFGKKILFEDVNLSFTKGNCYGVIGANGAGKSTFLKVIEGKIEPEKGTVSIDSGKRVSILSQDQSEFDNMRVIDTVLSGHKRLLEIIRLKEEIYSKENFTEVDGILAGELEAEFSDLSGWEADANARSLLNSIGINEELHDKMMNEIDSIIKVKVLLARALFGNPDILILDEPTNNLELSTIIWLENFLLNFENTVITVSHNRRFLNKVCTHICDIDYGKINIFLGNYDFWYETSQLMLEQKKDQNKKTEQKAKELREFIARFSANASKSKQATSRKKELEKLTIEDLTPSTRKYPYIDFKVDRLPGNDILVVEGLTKKGYFENVSFRVLKNEKIAFFAENNKNISVLFDILMGKSKQDSGKFTYGKTIKKSYMPINNEIYFKNKQINLIDWIKEYSDDNHEEYVRGWLGRMLFSGEEALKKVSVLSGGEKVRCVLAKLMINSGNFIIMDEPTNHLDLETITALNKGMINFKGNMLFASRDYEIVNTVADRIIEIKSCGTIDKKMTYDEFLEYKKTV